MKEEELHSEGSRRNANEKLGIHLLELGKSVEKENVFNSPVSL